MTWNPARLHDSLPAALAWLQGTEAGRAWLHDLPRLAGECIEMWRLTPEEPFPYAYVSLAVPAVTADGTQAVLKLQFFPDRESEHEALALEAWAGEGAVRLLRHDPIRHALLIERCIPGTPIAAAGLEAALDVFVGLLPRLWKPVPSTPFTALADEAARWASGLRPAWEASGRPFDGRLIDAAEEFLRILPASQGKQVLVHQDLHGLNVLAAEREPWLVIDPKPLAGEREFSLAPVIRSSELGDTRSDALRRFDRLTSELGLDRERVRGWCIAQTVAWSLGGEVIESHVQVARWLLETA